MTGVHMESLELRYLKRLAEMNKKFMTVVTLDLIETKAMLLTLLEFERIRLIQERGFPQEEFDQFLSSKLEEVRTKFHADTKALLDQLSSFPDLDTETIQ